VARLREVTDDDGRALLAPTLAHSFGTSPERALEWFLRDGAELRGFDDAGQLVGGLLTIPMAQCFGGQALPTCGVAGVGVDSSRRGKGTATRMMRAALEEMRDRGFLLSTLYASTAALYRRVGYESAGGWYELDLEVRELPRRASLPITSVDGKVVPRLQATYERFAKDRSGYLLRGPYVWERTTRRVGESPLRAFLAGDPRRPEGYVLCAQHLKSDDSFELVVADHAYLTPAGAETVLAILAEHRTLATRAKLRGSPQSALLLALPEERYEVRLRHGWMLRLVDVRGALMARGYPRGLSARVALHVVDEVLPHNSGSHLLRVEDGSPTVKDSRAKRGGVRLDVAALAAIFTGHARASDLATIGRAEGSPAALATLDALFAGPLPVCADFF